MKIKITFFFFFFFTLNIFSQILFEKIGNSPLVNTPTDSRSVNFIDVNNDGWDDIFVTNGASPGTPNLFFLNDGSGNFIQINSGDIVSHAAPFDGASFADMDNDGSLDAAVVTWYGALNYFYLGNGDGTFQYVGDAAPSLENSYSETAAWGDPDGDGDLDLYVSNSTNLNGTPLKNFYYKNEGNGNFTKIISGGFVVQARASRSVNWVDYDNDCDLDLFVSNEANQADNLYRNDGNGNFSLAPFAPSQSSLSTMSSSWGDVDNDGDLDLFVTNAAYFGEQKNQLFTNNGDATFTEITSGDLVTDGGCSYGSNFGDYDNDGDLDLVVSNGYCSGNTVNFLYENDGNGNFNRNLEAIEDLNTPCSYGAAWGDINNDGFLDLGIATCKNTSGASPSENLFYKNIGNGNNWLKIKPVGTTVNRSAIGARVSVTADINGEETTQLRDISAQSGYCGQNGMYAHFGLGDATVVKELHVQFACGLDTTLFDVPANQFLTITEGLTTPVIDLSFLEKWDIKISPNPVSDHFVLSFNPTTSINNLTLQLMDTTGQVLWENNFNNISPGYFEKTIDVKHIGVEAGTYILKISGDGSMAGEVLIVF
ncbi:MAG: FG-GAP-like repeat-containing protein [Bacteroidota bacterium]